MFSLDSVPHQVWGEAQGVQLSTVSGMALLDDGRVVVADQQGAVAYVLGGDSGSPRLLGRTGSGPGEYRRPEVLGTTDDGRIVVRDLQQFRILYWNADGLLRGSTGPGGKTDGMIWAPVAVLGEGQLVTTAVRYGHPAPAGSLRRMTAEVAIVESSGKTLTIGSFPYADFISLNLPVGGGMLVQGPQYFGWKLQVAAAHTFVAIGPGGGHWVRIYGLKGDSIGSINVSDARLPLSSDARAALIDRVMTQAQFGVNSASLAPERFADSLPVFGGLIASKTGVVWVVAPSWEGHAPAYMRAYDLRGALLGTVQLPRAFRPLAANDSSVAGYLFDSSDVPTIAVYRLKAPGPGRN
jgi:hypothetical protein